MSWTEVKYAINSTLGSLLFKPIDQYIVEQTIGAAEVRFDTPGTYSFVVPANIFEIFITACAGGAGGGGAGLHITGYDNSTRQGGGGGQCVYKKKFPVIPGQIISITVGAGGAGGSGATNTTASTLGLPGENTSVGDLLTLSGGLANGVGSADGTGGAGGGVAPRVTYTNPGCGSGGGGSLGSGGSGGIFSINTVSASATSSPGLPGQSGLIGSGGLPAIPFLLTQLTSGASNTSIPISFPGYPSVFGSGKKGTGLQSDQRTIDRRGGDGISGSGGGSGGTGYGAGVGVGGGDGGKGGDGLVIINY